MLFLDHELRRAGKDLDRPIARGLCTMEWSGRFLRSSSRRLVDCCTAAGVRLDAAHSASADARATAELLALCLGAVKPPAWHADLEDTRSYAWPMTQQPWPTVDLAGRSSQVPRRPGAWMDRIVGGNGADRAGVRRRPRGLPGAGHLAAVATVAPPTTRAAAAPTLAKAEVSIFMRCCFGLRGG